MTDILQMLSSGQIVFLLLVAMVCLTVIGLAMANAIGELGHKNCVPNEISTKE